MTKGLFSITVSRQCTFHGACVANLGVDTTSPPTTGSRWRPTGLVGRAGCVPPRIEGLEEVDGE